MSKKYGCFYEEELDKWEHLPATTLVLTSSYMGAWLLRRDERKGNRELIEALEKIKAEFEDEILLNQNVAIQIIDKHISEIKENKE